MTARKPSSSPRRSSAQRAATAPRPSLRPWRDFAILYRSNVAQSRLFEEALRRRQIPYKIVGGMSFLDRKEIKDVLCYWRLVSNIKDDASLRRILNYPARGIGKTVIEKLGGTPGVRAAEAVFRGALSDARASRSGAAPGCIQLRDLVLGLRQKLREAIEATPEMLSHWAMRSLEAIGIKRAIEQEEEDPAVVARKWESVEELVHSLGQLSLADFEGTALVGVKLLHDFLARMTLDATEAEEDKKDREKKEFNDEVTLLTLHGAKGLEYPIVYLVGMEEGFLPHKRSIEEATDFSEERRLCYVGITRARDHLILTRAKNRVRYGKPVPRYPSRLHRRHSQGASCSRKDESRTRPTFPTKRCAKSTRSKSKTSWPISGPGCSSKPKGGPHLLALPCVNK